MTKKEAHRIADRLGFYGEDGQYRTYREIHAKPKVSFQKRVLHIWRGLNKPREFIFTPGKGIRAMFLLVLLGLGVLLTVDQVLRVPQVEANPYPVFSRQQLWGYSSATSLLAGWNCRSASTGGNSAIVLDANTTHSSSCLTKEPMDLSVVSAKHLEVLMVWGLNATPGTYPSELGWYFTRNGTFPTEIADYSPASDNNVALLHRSVDGGGGIESGVLFIQRKESNTLVSGDPGGCGAGGTVFVCGDGSLPDTTAETSLKHLALNFTGNPGSSNSNSIFVIGEQPGQTEATTTNLPWFQFQAQQYYLGIYVRARDPNPIAIEWSSLGAAALKVYVSSPVAAQPEAPTQRIDTGGFFGPIIRALVSVGLFVLEQVAQFLGWLANLFVDAFDAIGGFFGLGAIGTQIRNALVGVGTWVSGVFGVIFGQAVSIGTAVGNALSALVQITGTYWTNLTSFLSGLTSFLGLLWPFIAFFGVGLPASALITIWLMIGTMETYNHDWPGFMKWSRMTWVFAATVFNISWEIAERAIDVILKVKKLLHPTAA